MRCWCDEREPDRVDHMWWGANRDGGRADADDAVKLPTAVYVGEPKNGGRAVHLRATYPDGRVICGDSVSFDFTLRNV